MAAHISERQLTYPGKAHINRLFLVYVKKSKSYIMMVGYISRHTVIYLAFFMKIINLVGYMSVCHDIWATIQTYILPIWQNLKKSPIYERMSRYMSNHPDIYPTNLTFLAKMTVYMSGWLDIYRDIRSYIVTAGLYIVILLHERMSDI